jgi:hypothetical protein
MSQACLGGSGEGTRRNVGALWAADWLAFAASPTDRCPGGGTAEMLCSATHVSPLSGMVTMYLLMSALHAAPWLRFDPALRPERSPTPSGSGAKWGGHGPSTAAAPLTNWQGALARFTSHERARRQRSSAAKWTAPGRCNHDSCGAGSGQDELYSMPTWKQSYGRRSPL